MKLKLIRSGFSIQDMSEKYLIAATVCYTDSSKRNISLRSTTQMPNIRGFGPLMALIFCPTMHVKCNREKTHYTAIRTGLGYDYAKKRPMFEEHDIVFNLNVEITQHDIELVSIVHRKNNSKAKNQYQSITFFEIIF